MSTITEIRGVPVQFPFKPYDIQKEYMDKVIECLQTESVAVLESPTGTGKTLSLLCSSLAWLQLKKAQLQAQRQTAIPKPPNDGNGYLEELKSELEDKAGEIAGGRMFLGVPTIIYASRTHSQLSQAMQELKRTAYSHMKANVLGSRDQLCIHPEIKAEKDSSLRLLTQHMCINKLHSKSCHLKNRVDKVKEDPQVCNFPIIDIEDMVKLGTKHTFCPYFMTKALKQNADIIFTPYNYLFDPLTSGLNLNNSVIILDEGHNIEKVCEEAASVELKTTDLLLAISELDVVMKLISETPALFEESAKDLDPDEVATFKGMLLRFTDVVQEVPLSPGDAAEISYPGDYIFEMLEKANITGANFLLLVGMIDKIIQFLMSQGNGPFARKGKGLQLLADFLNIAFVNKGSKDRIKRCYKVHLKQEEATGKGRRGAVNTWLSAKDPSTNVRVLSFWCFSPGFGMDLIMNQSIKAMILTSGTLAPMKPLISELELNVKIKLENPHIVTASQICVKILPVGPDGEPLNSSFKNRENPKYVISLGRAIVNLSRIIPNGLLIFFPSYPIMQKCQTAWQEQGIWATIMTQKTVFVEPRDKDAFSEAMTGYYEKIRDPTLKGAIFMAVLRGKVSEGLDFADANGRAVIITGLPYPPLKDPKVILKRQYLDQCHANDKEFLTGANWYSFEATRAVNQAIGRVIRHRYDYGAILLLDERFAGFGIKDQMSRWLRDHVKVVTKYGEVIRDLSQFFRKAQSELPAPEIKPPVNVPSASFDSPQTYKKGNFNFSTSSSFQTEAVQFEDSATTDDSINQYLGTSDNPNGTVKLHSSRRADMINSFKRSNDCSHLVNSGKRKKINLIANYRIPDEDEVDDPQASITEFVVMLRKKLGDNFKSFAAALQTYKTTSDLEEFLKIVDPLVPHDLRYIFIGLNKFIKKIHSTQYKEFLTRNNLSVPEEF